MLVDAASGVRHLHYHDVLHRDIALRNLLIDEHKRIVVADFGKQPTTLMTEITLTYSPTHSLTHNASPLYFLIFLSRLNLVVIVRILDDNAKKNVHV